MKFYLLFFVSLMLLLFALPKTGSMLSLSQQVELRKSCSYSKSQRFVKKPCAKKCLRHQTHSEKQNNTAGTTTDCNQQLYAVVGSAQAEPIISFVTSEKSLLPYIRQHLAPVLEQDPQPPRFS